MKVRIPFCEALTNSTEAKGQCKDDVSWPLFPKSIPIASRCEANPIASRCESTPQAEVFPDE